MDASKTIRAPVGVVTLTDVMRAFADGVVLAQRRSSLTSADAMRDTIAAAMAAAAAAEAEAAKP